MVVLRQKGLQLTASSGATNKIMQILKEIKKGIKFKTFILKRSLVVRHTNKKTSVAFRIFIIPLLLASTLFYFVHPTFAQLSDRETRLSQFLANGENVEVGIDTVEGFSHAFYLFEGAKTYLSIGSSNDKQVFTNGEYVVWAKDLNGVSQIILHNIVSKSILNLGRGEIDINPKVSKNGKVVWEGWVEDPNSPSKGNWQLFVFDGKITKQITQGDLSVHANIEGDFVVYARKAPGGLWRSEAYSVTEDKHIDIDSGNETEYPKLVDGEIYVGPPSEFQKKYPLRVEDLFLVDLVSQTDTPNTVTLESIQKELDALDISKEASSSAIPATNSAGTQVPTN